MNVKSKRTAEDKAEYARYLRGPVWRVKSNAVMARAGDICEFMIEVGEYKCEPILKRCTAKAVQCHHLTYEHIFNEPLEDLQALCAFHHKVAHVWKHELTCERCGNDVFDYIEDAARHVEAFADFDLENLYELAPSMCTYCEHMMDKDD